MRIEELDTPVLTVDLDAVGRNIARVQARSDELGVALRPHIKTHKLPAIAHMQLRAGASGIACQKLGEAEIMAAAGIRDILITFPLVGASKASRFAALAAECRVATVGDSEAVPRGLSAALADRGATAAFLVECDTGFGRTGVQTPQEAAELGALVDGLPGLRFEGFMTYPTLAGTAAWLDAAVLRGDRLMGFSRNDQRRRPVPGRIARDSRRATDRRVVCRRDCSRDFWFRPGDFAL